MDGYESILTKPDFREFAAKRVPDDIRANVLEAARMTGSSMNTQHWRFVLVQEKTGLKRLADDSTTGRWVENADFAIVILTNPKIPGSAIDGGRVLQDMQLAAWNFGVASCLYTGFKDAAMRKDFKIPAELKIDAVLGFGYPVKKLLGKKNRNPLDQVAFQESYGNPLKLGTPG